MEPRPDSPAFRPTSFRAAFRPRLPTLLVLLVMLGLVALQASCYRTTSVTVHRHGVSASKKSRGPVTVVCNSHEVAESRGVLFENHVFAKDGFEHRSAFLMLAASDSWFSIDSDSGFTQDPAGESDRLLVLGHADFSWGSELVHSSAVAAVSATPSTSGSGPAYNPNRVSFTVPVDTRELSAPADAPYLAFRGEQVPAPDGSLFLVILTPEGPKRPTRIGSALDLSTVAADPEEFAERILDEQPLLRELMQEGQ